MLTFKNYIIEEAIALDEIEKEMGEALNMQQRMKAKQTFRKNKASPFRD